MATAAIGDVVHPGAAGELVAEHRADRLVAWLFAGTGVLLFALMGLLGLAMRLAQADMLGLPASWFYRLMTLHGAGMLAGALLAMMGGLWFVLRSDVALSVGRMVATYVMMVLGAGLVVIATLVGGFATGWTFLWPLPFSSAGQWSTWPAVLYLAGLLLVGAGFFVFCIDVLARVTATYGGLSRAFGIPVLRGVTDGAPPPQAIAAAAVALTGLVTGGVAVTILMALLVRTFDPGIAIDALWAKNLTYSFGHTLANLIVYLGAGVVYVLIPRFTGRPWKTTKPIVVGWLATIALVLTAYSHHLYMDFVQPSALQALAAIASFGAMLPVAVVTIFTAVMLVWGSRYRWTLASTLLYLGFAGWAIGGVGAVIDSVIPINFTLHNTLWVPAHFHTYLLLGVIFWALAFVTHSLERAAGHPAARGPARAAVAGMLIGGYGLVAVWFVSGALGVPRRFAVHPAGTEGYSLAAVISVIIFAIGFLVLLGELARLAIAARRRSAGITGVPAVAPVPGHAATPGMTLLPPLATPGQMAAGLAVAVASLAAFLPAVSDATEGSVGLHHLAHAGQFLFGLALGLTVASLPAVFPLLTTRRAGVIGLVLVIAAPALMLLLMAPRFYASVEGRSALHALYHFAMAVPGFLTGIGCACIGRLTGRIVAVTSVGMALIFAIGVTGG